MISINNKVHSNKKIIIKKTRRLKLLKLKTQIVVQKWQFLREVYHMHHRLDHL